jgi:hypothetical protein
VPSELGELLDCHFDRLGIRVTAETTSTRKLPCSPLVHLRTGALAFIEHSRSTTNLSVSMDSFQVSPTCAGDKLNAFGLASGKTLLSHSQFSN